MLRHMIAGRRPQALFGAGALALVVAGGAAGYSLRDPVVNAAPEAAAPAGAATRTIGAGQDSYADLVARVAPAVVTVRSQRLVRQTQMPFSDDPLFRRFFGERMPMPRGPERQGGLGSGVIVKGDGYILTNNHVVEDASEIEVELTDGRTFTANVVGVDPPSDLAVLKIEDTNLPSLALGDSEGVRVGDVVLAIGNPLGVGQTVTMGIISAKGRATGLSDGSFEDFLQTDAPINRGNSGGALISTRGELVGINSQILTPTGGNIGIGFAIPANMARSVMTQLVETGHVRRGMLGVTIQPVTADLAATLGLSQPKGALVNSVNEGGPANRAGLERGDVITAIDGRPLADSNALRNEIAQTTPGSTVKLSILRDGKEQTLSATVGELEPRADESARVLEGGGEQSTFGLSVQPLTPQLADRLGVKAGTGVAVVDVAPGSKAADAGIRAGDVILEVNRRAVSAVPSLRDALEASADTPALLLVSRNGQTFFTTIG